MTKEMMVSGFAAASGPVRGTVKLALAAVLVALALAMVAPDRASAQEVGAADSDGYVPVYYSCFAGGDLGTYGWYYDGYAVYGTITVDSCAMDSLGAGPLDYERLLAHEFGHAAGHVHSLDPYDVMHHYFTITGT